MPFPFIDHGQGIWILGFPAQMVLSQDTGLSLRADCTPHKGGKGVAICRGREREWLPNCVSIYVLENPSEGVSWCKEKVGGPEAGGQLFLNYYILV